LQDILYVLRTNGYSGKVVVKNCMVQGSRSPESIVHGIQSLSQYNDNGKRLDLIVIARGGGSLEDLISFSSGVVLEAIHACDIFTISAIGHEVDFMLSDFVADRRAPTPSISGEIIIESYRNNLNEYNRNKLFIEQACQTINDKIDSYKVKVKSLSQQLRDIASNEIDKLENTDKRFLSVLKTGLSRFRNELERLSQVLQKHDIQAMLEQGYVMLVKNNRIVDSVNDVKYGQKLKIKMKDGELDIVVADNNKYVDF
jgi:exodeoxyribonuclease VII large subunit